MAKKILLADDSITIQKVVELTFSDGDYEIIAVNNGSKAIQKLQEIRPDIILSDIIMPEKNGYEVCEFVKSHPDFKTIPVILLTGTFEPFDPDRAERAGCDAVVTKPFESQSLIHKVDELIQQSTASAPSAPAAPPPNPFDETQSTHRTESASAPSAPSEDEPFAEPAPPSPEEIFGVGPSSAPAAPADRSGSVFDETNPPGGAAPSFDEPPAFSGETTAFPKMSLEDLQRMPMEGASEAAPEPPPPPAEQPDASWSAATTAFPKMSFADLQKLRDEETAQPPAPAPIEPPAPQPLEWPRAARPEDEAPRGGIPEPAAPSEGFGFDTEAEPPKALPFEPPPAPSFFEPPAAPEPPAFSAETTAFPKMSFDDLKRLKDESAPPAAEALPWTSAPEPLIGGSEASRAESSAFSSEESLPPPQAPGALSDGDIDRIARRVVELMSDKAVRDIAWEVIPDLAQAIVRERIKELETEG